MDTYTRAYKRLPSLTTLLPSAEPPRPQTWREQEAVLHLLAQMHGGRVTTKDERAERTTA